MNIAEQRALELAEAIKNENEELVDVILTRLASNLCDTFGSKTTAESFRHALNKTMLNMDESSMEEIEQKGRLNILKIGREE
jgi:hypothetical protein